MNQSLSVAEFTCFVDSYRQPLYGFIYGICSDKELCLDILQDTFAEAWNATRQTKAPFITGANTVEIRHWLFRVAYNRVVSIHRRQKHFQWESLGEHHELLEEFQIDPHYEDSIAEREIFERAFIDLSPQDVSCLVLIIVHRFTAAEVAELIGGNAQSISQRFSRAKRRLLNAYHLQVSANGGEQ